MVRKRRAELQVWVAQVPCEDDTVLAARQIALLSVEELQRMRSFRTAALQRRFRTTRALVRTVLSRHAPLPPENWEFVASRHGKPEVAPQLRHLSVPSFNISHTESLVVLLTGEDRALGVDIEQVNRPPPLDVSAQFFSEIEHRALARLPAAEQSARFWDLWTLKESYVKARGLGLTIPLDMFSIGLDASPDIWLDIDPSLGDCGDRWWLSLHDLTPDHRLAICAEARSCIGVEPEAWSVVPACDARPPQPLRLPVLRRSPASGAAPVDPPLCDRECADFGKHHGSLPPFLTAGVRT